MTALPLQVLGWRPFFQQQLSLEELSEQTIGRVIEHHRSQLAVLSEQGIQELQLTPNVTSVCVGDWLLFDHELRITRVLSRQSIFKRKAPGSNRELQLIAANIDTVMIVCSLNQDFNLNRIERYLAIAKEAQVEPVIVLTKADLCNDSEEKCQQVLALSPLLSVYALNALDVEAVSQLQPYCKEGQTLTFLGSSGVGKSTLVNTLMGMEVQRTSSIREDDSKGRHTTTSRAIKVMPQGSLLMDTPGMRELQLSDCEQGVSETFEEISALALKCKFNNCQHEQEPGCAIQAAIENGDLTKRRFESYQKLMREQAFNSASIAEKRAKDKAFGKMINSIQKDSRTFKNKR